MPSIYLWTVSIILGCHWTQSLTWIAISSWSCWWLNVLFISHAHAAVTIDAMTVSLSCPLLSSFPFSSFQFVMRLWGQETSSSLPSDWAMCEVIRCNESTHNSKDVRQKRRRGRMWHRKGDGEMFWRAPFERMRMGTSAADACVKQWEQVTALTIP